MDRHRKIGLSLSFCVTDILAGEVAVEDVVLIYAGTNGLAEVCERYRRSYWRKFDTAKVDAVLAALADRIIELKPAGLPAHNLGNGHWAVIMPTLEMVALDRVAREDIAQDDTSLRDLGEFIQAQFKRA
jgi:hypothetical protein